MYCFQQDQNDNLPDIPEEVEHISPAPVPDEPGCDVNGNAQLKEDDFSFQEGTDDSDTDEEMADMYAATVVIISI